MGVKVLTLVSTVVSVVWLCIYSSIIVASHNYTEAQLLLYVLYYILTMYNSILHRDIAAYTQQHSHLNCIAVSRSRLRVS